MLLPLWVLPLLLILCRPVAADWATDRADGGSSVIELTDASFEQLTQASTGATTGDWLVEFYAPSATPDTEPARPASPRPRDRQKQSETDNL